MRVPCLLGGNISFVATMLSLFVALCKKKEDIQAQREQCFISW